MNYFGPEIDTESWHRWVKKLFHLVFKAFWTTFSLQKIISFVSCRDIFWFEIFRAIGRNEGSWDMFIPKVTTEPSMKISWNTPRSFYFPGMHWNWYPEKLTTRERSVLTAVTCIFILILMFLRLLLTKCVVQVALCMY